MLNSFRARLIASALFIVVTACSRDAVSPSISSNPLLSARAAAAAIPALPAVPRNQNAKTGATSRQ